MIKLAKICLIVLTVFTMIFSSASLVMAQAIEEGKLKKADLDTANVSPENCMVFRDKVFNLSQGYYKTYWSSTKARPARGYSPGSPAKLIPVADGGRCIIVPSEFEDWLIGSIYGGGPNSQPASAKNFEAMILSSPDGVTELQLLTARMEAEEEKAQAGFFSRIVGWFLNTVLGAVAAFIGLITALVGKILVIVIEWTTSPVMPNIVETGWGIVRDFTNMFFILVMIVIGLAAILRLEQYDYRHLLGEVILMAILVNFSKVIAETIINFSNFLVLLFYNFDFYDIFIFLQKVAWGGFTDVTSGGWLSGLVQGLTKIIFMVITLGVFLILALMFAIRLVGLYVLVIISPMAYLLDILPATKNLAHQWWHKFIEYVIWAPVSMFFIKLSMLIVEGGGLESGARSGNSSFLVNYSNDSVFNYVILSGFMIAAVLIAEHAGMVGGKTVMKGAEKGLHMGAEFLARAYTKKITQKANQATLAGQNKKAALLRAAAFLDPHVAKKAWDQRSHHIEEEVYGPAIGHAHDTLNRFMPTEWHKNHHTGKMGLGRKTNYGAIEYNRIINKKTKEFNEAPLTEEQRVQLYVDATHLDDKIALLRSIVLNRHEDGLAGAWGMAYDSTSFKKKILEDLQHAGATSEEIGVQMNYISEIAEEGRKIRGMGMGVVDPDKVARAAADLSGIEKLDDAKLVDYLKNINVIDQSGNFIDKHGNVVQHAGANVTIRGQADFAAAKANTSGLNDANGEVFENEVIAARSAGEAIKRLKRTDSEDVAKALEPAAVAVQEADGSYSRLHSEGRRILEKMNPSVGHAVPGMRRTQARFQSIVGGTQSVDGTIHYDDVVTNPTKFNLLVEAVHDAPEIAAGFLTKARLDGKVGLQIQTLVNTALRTRYKGTKKSKAKLVYNAAKNEFDTEPF